MTEADQQFIKSVGSTKWCQALSAAWLTLRKDFCFADAELRTEIATAAAFAALGRRYSLELGPCEARALRVATGAARAALGTVVMPQPHRRSA